jgi:hypothetical protein
MRNRNEERRDERRYSPRNEDRYDYRDRPYPWDERGYGNNRPASNRYPGNGSWRNDRYEPQGRNANDRWRNDGPYDEYNERTYHFDPGDDWDDYDTHAWDDYDRNGIRNNYGARDRDRRDITRRAVSGGGREWHERSRHGDYERRGRPDEYADPGNRESQWVHDYEDYEGNRLADRPRGRMPHGHASFDEQERREISSPGGRPFRGGQGRDYGNFNDTYDEDRLEQGNRPYNRAEAIRAENFYYRGRKWRDDRGQDYGPADRNRRRQGYDEPYHERGRSENDNPGRNRLNKLENRNATHRASRW